MSCAGPNDEQSCQTRSLSQLIISNEGRMSRSPRSWAAASHSTQLQQREKISKCHCAGLAAQSLIRQIRPSVPVCSREPGLAGDGTHRQAGNIPASATQPVPPVPLQKQHSPVWQPQAALPACARLPAGSDTPYEDSSTFSVLKSSRERWFS